MIGAKALWMGALLACGQPHTRAEVRVAPASAPGPVQPTAAQVQGAWEKLGSREVDGKADHDTIVVGRDEGRFSAIQLQVEGSALEMFDVKVTFGDGSVFEPKTRLVFDKNSKSRVIDLPGDRRVIKRVDFRYGNLPGGGRARIELAGRSG